MSGSTISTYVGNPVTLGAGGYVSPLLVTGTGTISAAGADSTYYAALLIPSSEASATVTNYGQIDGLSFISGGDGVKVFSNATIFNNGVIRGGDAVQYPSGGYVNIAGTGVVINASGARLIDTSEIFGGNGTGNDGVANSGGVGIQVYGTSSVTVTKSGSIAGGYGGSYPSGYVSGFGGSGGDGAVISTGAKLINSGHITGGAGGVSGESRDGGAGGYGVSIINATLRNHGVIAGGAGGVGVKYGGRGGIGVSEDSNRHAAHLYNAGKIYGGAGGYGVVYGGLGQDGLVMSGKHDTAINVGSIYGGAGGSVASTGSFSGEGGAGVVVFSYATLDNKGKIFGGAGDYGGNGVALNGGSMINTGFIKGGENLSTNPGFSGDPGAGVQLIASIVINDGMIKGGAGAYHSGVGIQGGAGVDEEYGATMTNFGTIHGGAGGTSDGTGGNGGAGVILDGGTFINAGTVSAANGGLGGVANGDIGDAVQFTSRVGTLVVESGAVFNGKVVADAAVADVLEFSGTSTTRFSGIGIKYTGFNNIDFADGAQWTIAGNTTAFAGGQTITGFVAGDAIVLTNAAAGSGTVTVATAGTVSIHAGGTTYELDIAGATVGETGFTFSKYTLTESTPPAMAFLAPAETTAPAVKNAWPDLASVLNVSSYAQSFLWGTRAPIWFDHPTVSTAPAIGVSDDMNFAKAGNVAPLVTLHA